MTRPILTLLLLISTLVPVMALAPGDDINAFYKSKTASYIAARTLGAMTAFPGYETAVLGTDTGFTKPPFVLVLRKTNGPVVLAFGLVEGSVDTASLLIDTDGDGKLDLRTKRNLVPGWLGLKLPGKRGNGAAFRALEDRVYKQYDQNSGPVPAQLTLLVDALRANAADQNNVDRDLAGAFLAALDQAGSEPAMAAGAMLALSQALKTRGGDHPLPWLYRGEALVAIGQSKAKEAEAAFDKMLELDPKTTIGWFKKSQFSAEDLSAFKVLHPDFWASR